MKLLHLKNGGNKWKPTTEHKVMSCWFVFTAHSMQFVASVSNGSSVWLEGFLINEVWLESLQRKCSNEIYDLLALSNKPCMEIFGLDSTKRYLVRIEFIKIGTELHIAEMILDFLTFLSTRELLLINIWLIRFLILSNGKTKLLRDV